jgi:hypothetical protein
MVKDILKEHKEDRKVFMDSIRIMDNRLSSLEDEISEIKIIIKEK